ncbi:MAG: CoA transferase [Gammaproteobacteria bacterium]
MQRDRVLEIGHHAAGYCGRLFVHAGHEVVRIEPPNGAPAWASAAAMQGFLDTGKRRMTDVDPDTLTALANRADVVIFEAESADALAALGFDDWTTPVRVAITPFGRTGPRRNQPATPHTLLALGGYTQIMGDADRAPLTLPGHYVEFQAGSFAFIAANAARIAGAESAIDIGMLETVMALSQFTTVQWHCLGTVRRRSGNEFWTVCPSNLFRLRDGFIYVNIVPAFWDAFTLFIDHPELLIDGRFLNNDLRMRNREALNDIAASAIANMDRAEAVARAEAVRIPAGVVQTLDDVLVDPHLAARDFWQQVTLPDGRVVQAPRVSWRLDDGVRS